MSAGASRRRDDLAGHEPQPGSGLLRALGGEPFRPRAPRRYPEHAADIAHLLHIEPARASRRILRITLAHPRLHLTQVETGEAALDLLALKPFDLVLMNFALPRTTALETLGLIRRGAATWSDIPVVGLRDRRQRVRMGDFITAGLTDWTWRPVDRHALTDKIVALLPALHDAGL